MLRGERLLDTDRTSLHDYEQRSAISTLKQRDFLFLAHEDDKFRTCGARRASYARSSTASKWKECNFDFGRRWANIKPRQNNAERRKAILIFSFLWGKHAVSTVESGTDMDRWAALGRDRRIGGGHGWMGCMIALAGDCRISDSHVYFGCISLTS